LTSEGLVQQPPDGEEGRVGGGHRRGRHDRHGRPFGGLLLTILPHPVHSRLLGLQGEVNKLRVKQVIREGAGLEGHPCSGHVIFPPLTHFLHHLAHRSVSHEFRVADHELGSLQLADGEGGGVAREELMGDFSAQSHFDVFDACGGWV
jgi:hypothetical protein